MLKLAICQLRTELDQHETMDKAYRMISQAAGNGAQIVVLPEMWNCPYSREYFKKYAAKGHHEAVAAMSQWAEELGILLVGGSVPETDEGKIYNTCFVFDSQGRQIARHRKVHLFDVDLPDMRFRESSTFEPGEKITVFDTQFGKMGCAVCFDARFPELFRAMAVRGAQMVFLPAQFNTKTGPTHWEITLRMRAIDNEFFIVGASAARYEGFRYLSWGHSAVADPYGDIIAQCDEKEQILYSDIDLNRVDEVREILPTFKRLRRDVYSVAE